MLVATSLPVAIARLSLEPLASAVSVVSVIGGALAFTEAVSGASGVVVDTVHLTRVYGDFRCDVFMPPVDDARFALTGLTPRAVENGTEYQFLEFKNRTLHGLARTPRPSSAARPRHEELQYLDAIRYVRAEGAVCARRGTEAATPARA